MFSINGIKNIINSSVLTEINGKWYPAKPINYDIKYKPLTERIKDAWEVFRCRAYAFRWPGEE